MTTTLTEINRPSRTIDKAMRKSIRQRLTPAEAENAVYIDFEGTQRDPAMLLGVLLPNGDFTQYVIDQALHPAALAKLKDTESGNWCLSTDLEQAVRAVVDVAESANGPIVAFSTHDLDVILEHASGDLSTSVAARYRDAKATAKPWARRVHPDYQFVSKRWGSGRYSLDQFMTLAGYQVPRAFGPGNAGSRLSYVKDQLETRGEYSLLTPTAKAKWTKLLLHNYHDCFGMREVVTQAVGAATE